MSFMQRKVYTRKTPNDPTGTGQLKQYMINATQGNILKMSRYASNYFEAQVQGLEGDDPSALMWYKIRVSANFSSLNTQQTNLADDWRIVYFERPDIDYVPPGTKMYFWDNTWISENPANISSINGNALVRRCNAVWNSLDYYGNVVSEPMVITQPATKANANTDTEVVKLTDSYADCIMQANEWTLANLRNNTRMILGTSGFAVRGLSDYIREFTDKKDSVRLLRFSIYYQEPTERDDMVDQIADGLSFSWIISVTGGRTLQEGETAALTASSVRNGESVTGTDNPVTYLWSSLDESVATVDERTGEVTAIAAGQAIIRCTLSENQEIYTDATITVQAAVSGLAWASDLPENVPVYQSRTIKVSGATGPVSWAGSGASDEAYSLEANGDSATVTCYYPDEVPLTLTVTDGVTTLQVNIKLTAR